MIGVYHNQYHAKISDRKGRMYHLYFPNVAKDGKIDYYIGNKLHTAKLYFRHERTWDDHMGNTYCGYYINIPLGRNEKVRVYLFQ